MTCELHYCQTFVSSWRIWTSVSWFSLTYLTFVSCLTSSPSQSLLSGLPFQSIRSLLIYLDFVSVIVNLLDIRSSLPNLDFHCQHLLNFSICLSTFYWIFSSISIYGTFINVSTGWTSQMPTLIWLSYVPIPVGLSKCNTYCIFLIAKCLVNLNPFDFFSQSFDFFHSQVFDQL